MADVVNGTAGDDIIDNAWAGRTINNDEIISGLDGDDQLFGYGGNDTLNGGNGDDFLRGGIGQDVIDGGAGSDTADYADKSLSVVATLNEANNSTVTVGGVAEDTIRNIENLRGGSAADILTGDDNENILRGNAGADILNGGGAFDYTDYRNSTIGLTVSLAAPGTNTGDAAGDTFISIEGIIGSAFADHLIGDANNNFLRGGAGADVLDGGAGFDFAGYRGATSGVVASLANPAANFGEAVGDTYISIEGLQGSLFNDTLVGDNGSNQLRGLAGADTLIGGAGTDYADYRTAPTGVVASLADPSINTGDAAGDVYDSIEGLIGSDLNDTLIGDANTNFLRGGFGADTLNGGGGFDFADYRGNSQGDPTGAITASLANPSANTGAAAGDTYISIEGLIGSDFNDTLIGDAGDNFLQGGLGQDALNGGTGFDFADYDNAVAALTVSLANPATNTGEAAGDTFISIEGIRGSDYNDTLVGDGNTNFLRGGLGADALDGGAGFDFADYRYATSGITVNLANSAANTGEAAGDSFSSIEGIRGSAFNDTLIGDGNTNFLRGGLGGDALDGGGGEDFADYHDAATGVTVSLANPAVNTGEAAGDTFVSIEGLAGSDFADTLIGDGDANTLIGRGGGDVLNGGGGFDTAKYDYGDANTGVAAGVHASLAHASSNSGEAAGDSYVSIENLIGTKFADTLSGDSGANVLTGLGGDDTFVFTPGSNGDTITDFAAGSASGDKIILSGFSDIRTFANVTSHATQVGGDTVINAGGTDILTLTGVTKANLTADDFSFNTFDSASLKLAGFGSSAGAGGWSSDDIFHRTLADVNGDGRADIIGFGYSATVVSLANNSGGFDAPITGVNSFGYSPAGGNWSTDTLYHRTAADVNGDGMADLVGFGYGGTVVALATGGGHFANPTLTSTTFGSSAAAGGWSDNNLYHREVADVNGDGMADIVGFGNDGTYVALATGGGNFATASLASTAFGSSAAAGGWSNDNIYHRELADVNGDGMADIVGFGSDTTYVALATGGGHFAAAIAGIAGFGSSTAGGSWTDQTTYTRHLADINGDGRADIVGFGYSGTIIAYGNANGTFQPAQTDVAAFGASTAAGGWYNNELYPRLLGDVDGGGAADIVGFGYNGTSVAHSNVNWVG